MLKTSVLWGVAAAVLCSGVGAGAVYPDMDVCDVVRVNGPGAFTCRVADWPRVGAVRLCVKIRGLTRMDDVETAKVIEFIDAGLSQAKSIRLENIQGGSYFRVTADVRVDGRSLAADLISASLAAAVPDLAESSAEVDVRLSGVVVRPERLAQLQRQITTTPAAARAASAVPAAGQRTGPARFVMMSQLMSCRVDLSAWRQDMELAEALEILRQSTEVELPLVIMWQDLERNAFVDKHTPIGLAGVGRIPVRKALQLLLLSVAAGRGDVGFVVDGPMIVIATPELGLDSKYVTRVYPAGELTASPVTMMGGYGGGYGGGGYGNAAMMNGSGGYGPSGSAGGFGNYGNFGNQTGYNHTGPGW